jgi:ribosomal protein S18 acetylase RimI-like enzyme
MKIRFFKPQDIQQIVNLTNRFASFDADVTEADFQASRAFPRGFLVSVHDEQVIGFVFAYLKEIPSDILNKWDASKVAQIELVVVDPPYREQGIGKSLLDRLFEILQEEGVDLVLLHCPAEAVEAKRLYDKLGFEVRAYAMKKRL